MSIARDFLAKYKFVRFRGVRADVTFKDLPLVIRICCFTVSYVKGVIRNCIPVKTNRFPSSTVASTGKPNSTKLSV